MSKFINNREYRQQILKELISELHAGKSVDEVKKKFEETFDGVSAAEISEVEQALIMEGMPVSEVQRLCDVHAAVFKGSITEIHQTVAGFEAPGHPVSILKAENQAVEELIRELILPHLATFAKSEDDGSLAALQEDFELLSSIDLHYLKKENLLFPYMEKYGITAPPKVMWGVDDEIRTLVKDAKTALAKYNGSKNELLTKIEEATTKVTEMIFKEENIMLPMLTETLTGDEWRRIADEFGELGYCLITTVPSWNPLPDEAPAAKETPSPDSGLIFPTGVMKLQEVIKLLDTLPIDITFVDKDDTVKYFSQGLERIFPRTKAVIGRKVTNCHPPASVHIVEKIVSDFKAGIKDHEDFWIHMGSKFVLIRYYAVRDENGEYLGTLEVTQDIAPIQEITGEKRLLSE